jgi:hypothetical protein
MRSPFYDFHFGGHRARQTATHTFWVSEDRALEKTLDDAGVGHLDAIGEPVGGALRVALLVAERDALRTVALEASRHLRNLPASKESDDMKIAERLEKAAYTAALSADPADNEAR